MAALACQVPNLPLRNKEELWADRDFVLAAVQMLVQN